MGERRELRADRARTGRPEEGRIDELVEAGIDEGQPEEHA